MDPDGVGMVSGVSWCKGVLDGGGYRRRGRCSFGGEFGVSHCNQWGLCWVVVQKCMEKLRCCLAWWVGLTSHPCIRWRFTCPKRKGLFRGFFGNCALISLNGQNDAFFAEKCIWLVHEKLTVFPYSQDIVGIYISLAFRRYSQVRGQCWCLRKICKNVTLTSGADHPIRPYSSNACSKI